MINWEVGKAYKTRGGEKFIMDWLWLAPIESDWPVEFTNGYTCDLDGYYINPNERSPRDIIGEWEEPKTDPFTYKSPPANKTYTTDEFIAIMVRAFGGPLNEQKAPPTLTRKDFVAMHDQMLGRSVGDGDAMMLIRDNKPDDRRRRAPLDTAKQRRHKISQERLTSYRRNRAISHDYDEMWSDLVELRASDKPSDKSESRPWYEKI